MRHLARFWRNVTLITVVHLIALVALFRWASGSKIIGTEQITWLNTADETIATADAGTSQETPTPEPTLQSSTVDENQPAVTPLKSEIEIPAATPRPTATSTVIPSTTPKATPRTTPKKKASPKATATAEKKKAPVAAGSKVSAKKRVEKRREPEMMERKSRENAANGGKPGARGQPSTNAGSTNAGWYGNMLHDRFYREWAQPTTVVASGAKLSALARVRIEKDGRISDFKVVRSSGNVVVDESVQAIGKKVTRVDALPSGVGGAGHYDVNINFALNSE
jgi:TonB family protein